MHRAGSTDGVRSYSQIASSDLILLNKVDLVDSAKLAATRQAIASINSTAPIHETTRGVIDLQHILSINAYSAKAGAQVPRLPLTGESSQCCEDPTHDHSQLREQKDTARGHLANMSTLSIPLPVLSSQQYETLDKLLRDLLWEGNLPSTHSTGSSTDSVVAKPEILRTKGLFYTSSGDASKTEYIIQGVREIYEVKEVAETSANSGDEQGKLVFIGRGLHDGVREAFLAALRRP